MSLRSMRTMAGGVAVATLLAGLGTGAVAAPDDGRPQNGPAHRSDNLPGPMTERQEQLRERAIGMLRRGEATADANGVVQVDEDKYVQTEITGTDMVFTTLGEFGEQASGRFGREPGPEHGQIPAPDREEDNTTIWVEHFETAHYEDVLFGPDNSMADFYRAQSGGAYTVDGYVSDWVTVPGNGSSYGDNAIEYAGGAWQFVQDSVDAWYAGQPDPDAACALLDAYDTWDRYDHDKDGDFDEPDGYLDHYQAIHAGQGEETGGGVLGPDAIWSHRWYVGFGYGQTGPTVDGEQVLFGGAQIGDCNKYVGDYTTEPENGGLGVFAHEYAHDLGLPDLYDTAGGENSTAFWTLMSSGSYMNDGGDDIGSRPNHMGPWEKLQLGWLDHAAVGAGSTGSWTLGPAAQSNDGGALDALIIDVEDEAVETAYTTPPSGEHAWWSGSADDLENTLERTLDLTGVSRATVTAKAWYDIEAGYDYLYAQTSTDGGQTWTTLGNPIDGSSNGRWARLRWNITDGGQELQFRFLYKTDGGVHYAGAFLDDVTVTSGGTTLLTDDAETDGDWTADGWTRSTGTVSSTGDRYYLVENRQYVGYDETLETGPYNWSDLATMPNFAERFPFQDGMLVWVANETYGDNNTSQHPGKGLALPVDARPTPLTWEDGTMVRNRTQPFDATFGLDATDEVVLTREAVVGRGQGELVTQTLQVPSAAGITTFADTSENAYWDATNERGSTMTAGSGVTVTVTGQSGTDLTVEVGQTSAG